MIRIKGSKVALAAIDKHIFITDLVYLEGPVLSLFRHRNLNWLYLWCDTDGQQAERWLIFPVSRSDLVDYLQGSKTLLECVVGATQYLLLDQRNESANSKSYRWLRRVDDIANIADYLPAVDSFFDQELAPDISLALELSPSRFEVPIDGDWFFSDLDRFSRVYSQLYAFFYCTKPRFITSLGERVSKYLSSPWKGGYSRVNLFEALSRLIPSLHDLQIKEIRYASPGEIRIEALKSVGASVAEAALRYLEKQEELVPAEKIIDGLLGASKLKRVDVAQLRDDQLPLTVDQLKTLRGQINRVSTELGIGDEIGRVIEYAPNIVVTAKVVLALLVRVKKLAEFQQAGQVQLSK